MEWSREVPTVEGWYIRFNIVPTLYFLRDMSAEFKDISRPGLSLSLGHRMAHLEDISSFWWFGPILMPRG